jgi:DNA-binding MarR family transcriptional regulator
VRRSGHTETAERDCEEQSEANYSHKARVERLPLVRAGRVALVDRLDELAGQWKAERPDLDSGVMAEVARLLHVARLIGGRLAAYAAGHGLQLGEADVLLTLRRSGEPYSLSPTVLADSLLISTGAMTNRLDKLEARGLVSRDRHPSDRRALEIRLTPKGRKLVDDVVGGHVENERQMLAALNDREREQLTRITRKLLTHLDESA